MTKPPPLPLKSNDKVKIGINEYTGATRVEGGYELISVVDKSIHFSVSDDTILANLERGEVEVVQNFYKRIGPDGSPLDNLAISKLPIHERLEVCRRHAWVIFFLDGEKSGRWSRSTAGLKRAIAAIQGHEDYRALLLSIGAKRLSIGPVKEISPKELEKILHNSPRTLLRWVKMYEDGGQRAAGLCSRTSHRGNRLLKIEPQVRQLVRQIAQNYLQRTRPTRKAVYQDVVTALGKANAERAERGEPPLPLPSEKFLDRIIDSMDAYRVCVAREGREAADKKFGPVGAGPMVQRIGERVEGDEWKIHAFALLVRHDLWRHLTAEQREAARKARFSLVVFIDVATKVILGLHLCHSAETDSAIKALSLIGRDKTSIAEGFGCATTWNFACRPELVVTDNGPQFLAYDFHSAVIASGSELQFTVAGKADQRATMERFFQRIHVDLIGTLPGKTFSDANARGDYNSKALASLTVDEVIYIIIRYIVDEYHNTDHEGIEGYTPLQKWGLCAARYGVPPPPTPAMRRLAWGRRITRRLGPTGVTFMGIDYNSSELAEHFRRHDRIDVQVCVDADNLDEVSVLVDAGWVSVSQRIPGLAEGLNLDQWQQVLAEVRRRVGENREIHRDVIARARADIRQIIEASRGRAELLEYRPSEEELARWERAHGLGFRVVGDPVLAASEPTDIFGIRFPTGGNFAASTISEGPIGETAVSPTDAPVIPGEPAAMSGTPSAKPLRKHHRDERLGNPSGSELPDLNPNLQDDDDDDIFI